MKIGILSMQRINNIGSLLQSYALKKVFEKMNVEVEFIDIKRNENEYALLDEYKNKNRKKNIIQHLGDKIDKLDKYTFSRLRLKKLNNIQNQEFEKFRKEKLEIDKVSSSYDMCVIGSDEVFNCLNSGAWGFTSQLFGNVPEARKIITYAASCGETRYEELPVKISKCIKDSFEKISAFSARDKNTHEFISKLTDEKINDNLDPVLIYDFTEEIDKEPEILGLPEHYCVIYSYYNRIHTDKEINAIKTFCKKNKLVPIAVGAPQFWIKDYFTCTPFQCLKIFQKADFVITDTFHGTIFSAKYSKKYAVIVRESNRNKLLDLINKLKIEEHLIKDMNELQKENYFNDYDMFQHIIEKEKLKTVKYLREAIEE